MDQLSHSVEDRIADAERVQADFVRTELLLGLAYLDVAGCSAEPTTARRCVRNAIAALRTANRFLAKIRGIERDDDIRQHRDELRARVRQIAPARRPAESSHGPDSRRSRSSASL